MTTDGTGDNSENLDLKWIQYIPNSFGKNKMNIDSAIKSIYKPKYTNISDKKELRPKFGQKVGKYLNDGKSFLYGR